MKYTILMLTSLTVFACSPKEDAVDSDDNITDDSNDTNDDIYSNVFDLVEVLNDPVGCGDFIFYDRDDTDSMSLEISGSGLAEAAHSAGEPMSYTFDLSELGDDIVIESLRGSNLTHGICGDVLDPSLETTIDSVFIPVNGTLTLTFTPTGEATEWEYPTELEVHLQMSDFCADIGNGDTHHENCFNISEYTATAYIGWFPG